MTLTMQALAAELEPAVEQATARHLSVARQWFPHEYVPWSQGRDFAELPWDQTQSALSPAVRASVQLNLLTEDNLPGYHRELSRVFGGEGAWRVWTDRWTAEEGRHAVAIRDYLLVTRAVDPVPLELERMATMETGFRAPEKDLLRTLAYVSLQELATRVAHRNTGLVSGEPLLDRLLGRVAADENLHMVFYRSLVAQALEVDPAATLTAIAREIEGFAMPGTGIPGFVRKAALVARAGIYDLAIHRDEVVAPLLAFWDVFGRTGLPAEAERAREQIAAVVAELDRRVTRLQARTERAAAAAV